MLEVGKFKHLPLHRCINSWGQWKVLILLFWPQVTWGEVTLIQPLLMHWTMTLYTTDKPQLGHSLHGFTICCQFTFTPVTLSFLVFHPSSLPLPLILPSGQCIRVVWEDLDIMRFPCVITISHQCPVSSRCHVVTFCRLCLHTLLSPPFLEILSTFWSVRSRFPRCRDKRLGVLPRGKLKCWGQVNFSASAVMPSYRLRTMRDMNMQLLLSHYCKSSKSQ